MWTTPLVALFGRTIEQGIARQRPISRESLSLSPDELLLLFNSQCATFFAYQWLGCTSPSGSSFRFEP